LALAFLLSEPLGVCAQQKVPIWKEPKRAFLVGINDYEEETGMPALHQAVNDANGLAKELVAQGYNSNDISILTNQHVTKVVLLTRLRSFAAQFEGDKGTLIFAFSGHGGTGADGKQYLALWETDGKDIKNTGVAVDEIQTIIRDAHARQKIMLLDACRNAPPPTPEELKKPAARIVPPAPLPPWDELKAASGIRVLNATSKGSRSWEDPNLGHGVFTNFVIDALHKAPRAEGMLTFEKMESWVHDQVVAYMKTISPDGKKLQEPYESPGEHVGNFYIAGQPGTRRALVLGNQKYQKVENGAARDWSLLSARKDAQDVSIRLAGLGFVVGKPVLDETRAGMEKALTEFGQKVQDEDVVLVYYAGAGVMMEGDPTLVSSDSCIFEGAMRADARTRDAPPCTDGLKLSKVLSEVKAGRPGATIVMMDMCLPRMGKRLTLDKAKIGTDNTLLVFAAEAGFSAYETDEGGVFTRAFLNVLDSGVSTDDLVGQLATEIDRRVDKLPGKPSQTPTQGIPQMKVRPEVHLTSTTQ
jgi:uncharacterized caspase-like protein